jgi:hypothetical protein
VQENPPHENLPGSHVVGVTVSEDAGKTPTPGEKSRGYRAGRKTRRHHTPIMWTAGANPVRIFIYNVELSRKWGIGKMTDRELANIIMHRYDKFASNNNFKFRGWDNEKISLLVEAIITELREHGMLKQG